MIYALADLYRDFRIFTGLASPEEIRAMLAKSRSEAQEAIDEAQKEEEA